MEKRPKTTFLTDQNRRPSNPKFKPLKSDYNELQSKYDVYKNGSPNSYEQNLDNLKAYNIKNNVKVLQLAGIEYLLREMKNIRANTGTSLRDYVVHPTMMQKYGSRFKNMVSDGQEMRDFMDWFTKKDRQIQGKICKASDKFGLSQSLIASGFNEILTQVACVSRARADALRMLWNKQNTEVENIFNFMHKENTESEKRNLEAVKSLHLGYQEQIISLRNQNYLLEKKVEQASILNEGCINTMRIMRKQIKKYQKIIKQLNEANSSLKMQSVQILEENINLIMKEKNIPFEKARILSYQALRLNNMKKQLKQNKSVKSVFMDAKNKAEAMIQNSEAQDLENKKEKLVKYITQRIKDNPAEKTFIMKGEISDDDDQEIRLEKNVEEMLTCRQLKAELQEKTPKKFNFFEDRAVNTDSDGVNFPACTWQQKAETVATQTSFPFEHQKLNSLTPSSSQQSQGRTLLQKKKTQQRHSLIMIQMSKMMEFQKMDSNTKRKRVSPFNNTSQGFSRFMGHNRFSSLADQSVLNIEEEEQSEPECQISVLESFRKSKDKQDSKQEEQLKKREHNIMRRHHESLLTEKSSQFQQLMQIISRENSQIQPDKELPKHEVIFQKTQIYKELPKIDELTQKMNDIKELVKKYLEKRVHQKQTSTNPEKQLKKILTDTFKNIFISKKTNFFKEMLRTAKNSYGKVIYENKIIHLISLIIENKDKSLLGALAYLLGIPIGQNQNYEKINQEDISEIYFKMYFYLSSKTPVQSQFNIWGNYTTLQKMNSPSFTEILRSFFSESKCLYLQLKIRQFVGMGNMESIEGNYYVQINPLMMYIMEVYMLEKQNYYESYHGLIDFLAHGDGLDLETFVFLLDLLCFKEDEQKEIIKLYFKENGENRESTSGLCHKDIFYRVCVRYQLPLFEFIKILKLEQFKKLHECLQTEFADISDAEKWSRVRQNIEKMLMMKGNYTSDLKNIIGKLNQHVKLSCNVNASFSSEPFLFLYRIVIHAAFISS